MSRCRSSLRWSISDIAPSRSSGDLPPPLRERPHRSDGASGSGRSGAVEPSRPERPQEPAAGRRLGEPSAGGRRLRGSPGVLRIAWVARRCAASGAWRSRRGSSARPGGRRPSRPSPGVTPPAALRNSSTAPVARRRRSISEDTRSRTSFCTSRNCRITRPDRAGELGQPFGPHHDQRHGEDDEELEGSYVEHRFRDVPGSESIGGPCGGRAASDRWGRPLGEARRRVGGSRRGGGHLVGDRLELLLHPARRPSEQDHVADEEPEHHEERAGGHEADHEPDDEPGFHAEDATGRIGKGRRDASATTPRSRPGTP